MLKNYFGMFDQMTRNYIQMFWCQELISSLHTCKCMHLEPPVYTIARNVVSKHFVFNWTEWIANILRDKFIALKAYNSNVCCKKRKHISFGFINECTETFVIREILLVQALTWKRHKSKARMNLTFFFLYETKTLDDVL